MSAGNAHYRNRIRGLILGGLILLAMIMAMEQNLSQTMVI